MPISDDDIADLATTTLTSQRKGKFTDISQELHDYIVVPYLLTQRGGMKVKRGGQGIEETIMYQHGDGARWIGEYDEDVVNVIDHLKKMKVNWCLLTASLAYTRSEMLNNRGKERINDIIKPRRLAMYLSVAQLMEEAFFGTPDADDDLTMWGLEYWITKNSTTGFNGSYAPGFTRKGGINDTIVTGFKNWTAPYTAVSKVDLISAMKKAHRQTHWKSPRKMSGVEGDSMPDKRILLCNEDILEDVEDIGEAQNENIGRDIAAYNAGMGLTKNVDGEILFKKKPFIWCEELDSDTSDPVYGVDLSTFNMLAQAGDNMRLGKFKPSPKQHRTVEAHLDHKCQTICTNPRNNFCISK